MSFSVPIVTAFKDSPDRGRGLARDFRVRWAFEEVGQPYEMKLLTFAELKQAQYKDGSQPFGQIPAYQEGDLVIFETGAILFHIAENHKGLLPSDTKARARAIAWMFSAVSTMEPPIVAREASVLVENAKPWFKDRLAIEDERVHMRLKDLAGRLGDSEWLDGAFSVADILMVTVLRRLGTSGLLASYPNLVAYIARGEARPAYQRAFAAQLKVFNESSNANPVLDAVKDPEAISKK